MVTFFYVLRMPTTLFAVWPHRGWITDMARGTWVRWRHHPRDNSLHHPCTISRVTTTLRNSTQSPEPVGNDRVYFFTWGGTYTRTRTHHSSRTGFVVPATMVCDWIIHSRPSQLGDSYQRQILFGHATGPGVVCSSTHNHHPSATTCVTHRTRRTFCRCTPIRWE
jgi:hypothetical protein